MRAEATAGPSLPRRSRRLPASFGRSSAWALGAEGIRLLGALIVFVVVATTYGPDDYGVLIGTLAMMWLVHPIAGAGAGLLLVQRVARGGGFAPAFAAAVGALSLASIATVALLAVAQPFLLPQSSVAIVVLFGLGELWAFGLVELVHWAGQATERLRLAAVARLVIAVARGLGALAFWLLVDDPELWWWPAVHLATATVAAAVCLVVVHRALAPLARPVLPSRRDLTEGLGYATGFAADEVRVNLDAVLLVRFGLGVEAGLYAAAYRLVSFALVPLRAMVHATNARFFTFADRPGGAAALARRLTVLGMAVGAALGGVLAVAAPFVVDVLGDEYEGLTPVLRALAVLPALTAVEVFAATAVTGIGRHPQRLVAMITAAGINLAANLVLIPAYGWAGAFIATVGASAVYGLWVWVLLLRAVPASARS